MNDLGLRDRLAEMLNIANDRGFIELLKWAVPKLDQLDENFWQKTNPDEDGLMWGYYLEPTAWWKRRLPSDDGLLESFKTVGPEMRESCYPGN